MREGAHLYNIGHAIMRNEISIHNFNQKKRLPGRFDGIDIAKE
jgi:hypothetical protein